MARALRPAIEISKLLERNRPSRHPEPDLVSRLGPLHRRNPGIRLRQVLAPRAPWPSLPHAQHHDAALRWSDSHRIAQKSQILVRPKIARMHRPGKPQVLERNRHRLRHIIGHKVENGQRLCAAGKLPHPGLERREPESLRRPGYPDPPRSLPCSSGCSSWSRPSC